MPLSSGYSENALSKNIVMLTRKGHTKAEAQALALQRARKAWRRNHPAGAYPVHLKTKRKTNPRPPHTKTQKKKLSSSRSYVNRPSQITRNTPAKRLKTRRATNTQPGYYPNPNAHKNYYVIKGVNGKTRYFDGMRFVSSKRDAAIWHSSKTATKIAQALANKIKEQTGVYSEKK